MPEIQPEIRKCKYLVLGAGPTGLGAAYRFKELGETDFLVVDAAGKVGGLSASFTDAKGFVWDIGGHVQFSHYGYFDQVMKRALGEHGWLHHQRESWVWIRDRFIPYPFQNNIRHLPPKEKWDCLQGLIRLYKEQNTKRPANFKEWIHATFGSGLAQVFMEPYNFKVWAQPLEEMDFNWIGERVAVTDLERVLKNIFEENDDLSWGPNNTFQFPKQGGTGAIWESVANLCGREKIHLNAPVTSIDLKRKICSLGEKKIKFETLLSSIPLDSFVSLAHEISSEAKVAAQKLKYSSSNIVGIGMEGQPPSALKTKCWMYFPEDNCPFYRVTVFSHYSPQNVPQPGNQWSLMAEVSESAAKPVNSGTLVADVVRGLKATKLMDPDTPIVSSWTYRAHHGYPTPFLGRDEVLKTIHASLEPLNVFSRGRFGGWKYEVSNQDHSFMQGVEWVNRMKLGIPETTYPFPSVANANWAK